MTGLRESSVKDEVSGWKLADTKNEQLTETKVETTVDNDTDNGGNETTVETGNTVGSQSLPVDINQSVELTRTTLGSRLVVVGETGTGVVERVDEKQRRGTSSSTGSNVTSEPLGVGLRLLEVEHGLEVVLEGKVQRLGREVPDDVGGVSSPEGNHTLIGISPPEAVGDTLVRGSQTTLLDPVKTKCQRQLQLTCSMDQELDAYISSWFWTKSLIRSIGAAAVLAMAAETPPIMKSLSKPVFEYEPRRWRCAQMLEMSYSRKESLGILWLLDQVLGLLSGSGSGRHFDVLEDRKRCRERRVSRFDRICVIGI